ncbi:MAG TPA: IS1595 family transposase [Prolixibacteraceae bacterium]|nr:IS1595 family transposase [Prolixibacteraceae bacterium]
MAIVEHYPKDFQEFLNQFKSEEDCWNYIFELRWPNGYTCPRCYSNKYWLTEKRLIHCSSCENQTSITGGTIFQGTRKPLLLWFHIIWWVVAQKTGASASNLKDFMGFGSYETAWVWLHKLRRAMVRPDRDKLVGSVEVDETYIGGKEIGKGKQGRGAETKTLVVVAAECKGKQIGRVRFSCISDASGENLLRFIEDNIEPGSTIITDGWRGYSSLSQSKKYKHESKIISGSGQEAHELLPHVHMVDSLVKRWINGTHQGNVSPKHLSYYLDEFAFRFNRKLSTYRGKLFYRLMQQAVTTPPMPLKEIVKENQLV